MNFVWAFQGQIGALQESKRTEQIDIHVYKTISNEKCGSHRNERPKRSIKLQGDAADLFAIYRAMWGRDQRLGTRISILEFQNEHNVF